METVAEGYYKSMSAAVSFGGLGEGDGGSKISYLCVQVVAFRVVTVAMTVKLKFSLQVHDGEVRMT